MSGQEQSDRSSWLRALTNLSAKRRRLVAAAVLLIAAAIILIGVVLTTKDTSELGASLAEVLPQVFPSPTATATSTPTIEEQIEFLLAKADQAWQAQDAQRAIAKLEEAHSLQPEHSLVVERLFVAHATLGLLLAEADELDEAVAQFDIALRLRPENDRVQQARDMIVGYLSAVQELTEGESGQAANALEALYGLDANYRDVASLLRQARYEHGLQLQESGDLQAARAEYSRVIEISPDDRLARAQLHEVDYLLATPTPTATFTPTPSPTPTATPVPEKRILVDISQQRFWVYEDDEIKWDFACSTGRQGSPTRRGTFSILDKIPNAWGGAWNIWMPYWLGIYWAGGTENGIHALPVSLDGSVLWSGYLGTPISFGCIVLDTWAATLVYEWVDIGTPITIRD